MPSITVQVQAAPGGEPPAAGLHLIVQIRDAGLQDAAAPLLGESRVQIASTQGDLGSVQVEVSERGTYPIVWAHVDSDGDGKVSKGDWITTQSFPVPAGEEPRVTVTVHQVK